MTIVFVHFAPSLYDDAQIGFLENVSYALPEAAKLHPPQSKSIEYL
jgi:hypothetical protein